MASLAFLPMALTFIGFAACLVTRQLAAQRAISIATALAYCGFGFWLLTGGAAELPLSYALGGWPAPFGISLDLDFFAALLVTGNGDHLPGCASLRRSR